MWNEKPRQAFESVQDFFNTYGEPCNNCELFTGGSLCENDHRQRKVSISTGHIAELTCCRQGGCPDWIILTSKTDAWWGEEPLRPFSSVYGGTKTDILV